ncbi:MAG TPA: DUF3095 domain-containing protein [Polyangiaceae bacterium]|nr:DUF3095 domain-containing protein [Polyangiaceae bacterium]
MLEDFLHAVPEIERFADVTEPRFYRDAPDHWHIVLTDVRGSTKAIEAGRYRDVNALGVASIVAIRNATPDLELPYVFGGDGATLLVPDSRRAVCEAALRGVRKLARSAFELELRVGLVRVGELRSAGHAVQVARYRASPFVRLAMLRGSGIAQAERWVKDAEAGARYGVSEDGPDEANFEGFECRWQPVPTRRGHVVSMIVQALDATEADRARSYRRTIAALEAALEGDAGHPVSLRGLRLGTLFGDYAIEARLRSGAAEGPAFRAAQARARKKSLIGRALIALGASAGGFDGKAYPVELVANSDFRKFDEALRMVLDVSAEQLAVVEAELEHLRAEGHVVYGLHRAPSALITCYLRSYSGDHVHFVDGSDGGYALAARQLKAQLAELRATGR